MLLLFFSMFFILSMALISHLGKMHKAEEYVMKGLCAIMLKKLKEKLLSDFLNLQMPFYSHREFCLICIFHISKLWHNLKAALFFSACWGVIESVSKWQFECDFQCLVCEECCMSSVFLYEMAVSCHSQAGPVNPFLLRV